MIVLRNLCKTYRLYGQSRTVANNINAVFPSNVSVALLGRNGAGKSTLLRMISGASDPTSGEILSTGSISFPIGFAGSFNNDMTGAQNTRFVARAYGADTESMKDYVEEFAELGQHFYLPLRAYSSGMKSRLSFGVSMALQFDTYLVDEVTGVGDAQFKKKSGAVFKDRMKNAGAIFCSHSMNAVREMCQAGCILENGILTYYSDVEEAIERHTFNMVGTTTPSGKPPKSKAVAVEPDAAEASDFPADARMLYVIGAQHAGSQWLLDYLRRNRACHFTSNKEVHYFDIMAGHAQDVLRRRQKTLRELAGRVQVDKAETNSNSLRLLGEVIGLLSMYEKSAEGAPPHRAYQEYMLKERHRQSVVCDVTPTYAYLTAPMFAEMAAIGAARFVFLLRNPVDRLWAQICASFPTGRLSDAERLDACAKAAQRMIADGNLASQLAVDYERTLAELDAVVPADRIKVLFFEQLFQQDTMDDLCALLQINPRPVDPAPSLANDIALPDDLAAALRQALAPQYDAARKRFGDALPQGWA